MWKSIIWLLQGGEHPKLRHASDSNDPKTRVHHCLVDPSAERQAAAKGIEGISPIPSEMRHQGNRALPGRHRRHMIRLSDWFLIVLITLRLSNMTSCSNPSFVDDCPIKTSIYRAFPCFSHCHVWLRGVHALIPDQSWWFSRHFEINFQQKRHHAHKHGLLSQLTINWSLESRNVRSEYPESLRFLFHQNQPGMVSLPSPSPKTLINGWDFNHPQMIYYWLFLGVQH